MYQEFRAKVVKMNTKYMYTFAAKYIGVNKDTLMFLNFETRMDNPNARENMKQMLFNQYFKNNPDELPTMSSKEKYERFNRRRAQLLVFLLRNGRQHLRKENKIKATSTKRYVKPVNNKYTYSKFPTLRKHTESQIDTLLMNASLRNGESRKGRPTKVTLDDFEFIYINFKRGVPVKELTQLVPYSYQQIYSILKGSSCQDYYQFLNVTPLM